MAALGAWGRRHLAVSEELAIRAQLLEEGGPALWDKFMAERLHAAFQEVPARNARGPG